MEQLTDTSWSPTKTEHIVGTRQAVANTARESLAWIVSKRLELIPEDKHIEVMTLAAKLDNVIAKFEAEGKVIRIAELEAELTQLCEDGEKAKAEYVEASNNETTVRRADAMRQNRHSAAIRALSNLKNTPLPEFHTNKHLLKRLDAIATAQAELDDALADMVKHPNAIPGAVQAKRLAKLKVDSLIAKVRAVRRELASLKGEDAPQTAASDSGTGLGGLR
jgi:hypothetical protein